MMRPRPQRVSLRPDDMPADPSRFTRVNALFARPTGARTDYTYRKRRPSDMLARFFA
jgi:hypothetical protein